MNYYKDISNGDVYAYDDDQVTEGWVKSNLIKMTKKEVEDHINPPVTKEELIAEAEARKQALITDVNTETQMLQTKLALGRIKDDEKVRLNAWLDYLDELEAVDVSTAPNIIWPVKPEV